LTFPYCAIPTSLNGRTGPRLVTRTVCPILKCCSSAVARSITTWSDELGQWPEVKRNGLKRGSEKSTPNPNEGAPFVEITLPFEFRILAAVWSATLPAAASTSGSFRTWARTESRTDGVCDVSPLKLMSGDLPLTTASVPA
jgi:hypothetical protein